MDGARTPWLSENIPVEDLQFLMTTELLQATPDKFKRRLISLMLPKKLEGGTRFIHQGQKGDYFYVIQNGSCVVSLEKNGQSHPIARLKRGDIVGEVSILTGENRSANVDSETDLVLWGVGLEQFEKISEECPELLEFLTDIATERLCSQKITAERAIGRYTINEVLAEGGWSIVYKGAHSFLNLPVAIKMLKHNMARDADMLNKFQNEAKIIAGLNHENIVKVYDVENVYRTVFIVMEHLEGVTLRHILKKKLRLPFPRALQILIQVCSGLNYAHGQGIVHQDVKPGNIFIEKNDRVKIVDFGLASPIGGCSNELPGTVFYMAPEQIEGEPVDPRTDIYSLGITAYEMVTGRRPFPDDVCEVLKAHITEPMPNPRMLNPDLPEAFCGFIARATQKEPSLRYDNLGQVLEDLNSIAQRTTPFEFTEPTRSRKRMMSLLMFYEESHQLGLNQLMKTFGEQVKELGIELKIADFD